MNNQYTNTGVEIKSACVFGDIIQLGKEIIRR